MAAAVVVGVAMVMSMVVAIVHGLLMHVAESVAVLRSLVVVAEGQTVVTGLLACLLA